MAGKPKEAEVTPLRPVSENENLLRKKFYESIAAQSEMMDKLAERLLALELGIPGLFATVVKLTRGEDAVMTINAALNAAFALWLAALILTLLALTPKAWKVDVGLMKQDPKKLDQALGIEDFFTQSALRKRRLLTYSSLLFFAGIFAAMFAL